jgi:hypothetical protein
VLTEAAAQPPEKTETMSFLSGSYRGLAARALARTSEAATLPVVDAVLAGLAGFGSMSMRSPSMPSPVSARTAAPLAGLPHLGTARWRRAASTE